MSVQESVDRVVPRRRSRAKPVVVPDWKAPAHPPLPPALERLFVLIAKPVLKLERTPDGQQTLHEIGILLGDVLDLLEEDPAITRAADRLYETAYGVQEARESQSTCAKFTASVIGKRHRSLHRMLSGFRKSLCSAKPSARARVHGSGW